MTAQFGMIWRYEADEDPKRKHHWNKDHAGFVKVGPNRIGKCPAKMSAYDAEALLNDAIPYFPPRWSKPYPKRLYAVSDGVVYRASPTNPGTLLPWVPRASVGIPPDPEREERQATTAGAG